MKISKGTIARTVLMAIAILNTIMRAAGLDTLPFTDEQIGTAITAGYDAIVTLWVWWKNQSFTNAAISADAVMNRIKSGEFSLLEVRAALNDLEDEAHGQ
jgi:SPP1 family holin